MEIVDFLGKGFSYPFSVKKSKMRTAENEVSIKESIMLILATSRGERVMRPTFGCRLHEMVFDSIDMCTSTLIQTYVEEALLNWEPRIEVKGVTTNTSYDEPMIEIEIDYLIKASNSKDNLVYPFYLESVGK